jgi:hypothetical protein
MSPSKEKEKEAKKKIPPVEVWSGVPDDPLPNDQPWPPGWRKRILERQSGTSKGTKDRYWYTPKQRYALRSMVEVKRFLEALSQCDGNEDKAMAKISLKTASPKKNKPSSSQAPDADNKRKKKKKKTEKEEKSPVAASGTAAVASSTVAAAAAAVKSSAASE